MASKTEGIALLSLYNDEEEEEEEEEEEKEEQVKEEEKEEHHQQPEQEPTDIVVEQQSDGILNHHPDSVPSKSSPSPSPDSKTLTSLRSPTPPPFQMLPSSSTSTSPSPSPPPPPIQNAESVDDQRMRIGALGIVDYDHDETNMSPDPKEGEGVSSRPIVDQVSEGNIEGRTPPGTVQMLTSNIPGNIEGRTPPGTVQMLTSNSQRDCTQPSDLPDQSKSETSMATDLTGTEPLIDQTEVAAVVSVEMQETDPLKNFLPPPQTMKCPDELQEKINKFLAYKRAGKSFNADLRNRKDYRNPDFLQHAVRYQDIDQIGTCFSKDVFDPRGYDKSDYYDEIEADMKREMERKEQERKRSQKVEFVAGGTQAAAVPPALKMNTQIAVGGISTAVTNGLPSVSTAVDALSREIRQNKKTKWDKFDGDVKNPLHSGGHDSLPAVGVHAAHLSAASAGTGYTAFAQQKRREAEERRSSGERKFDKIS